MSNKNVIVPTRTIIVYRDGANVPLKAGVAVEITDAELANVKAAEKATGETMFREPNNETAMKVEPADKDAVFAELTRKATDALSAAAGTKATTKQKDLAKSSVVNAVAFAKANKLVLPEDIAKAGGVKVDEFVGDDEGL